MDGASGGSEILVSRGEKDRVSWQRERPELAEHVGKDRLHAGSALDLGLGVDDRGEEGEAYRKRQGRARGRGGGLRIEVFVDAMPPMLDAGGELLRLGREGLSLDEDGEGVDRDVLGVPQHHGGGLASFEHARQPKRIGRSELAAIEQRGIGGVGILKGDPGEVQDVAGLDQLEEGVLAIGRALHRDDEFADQRLEGTELEACEFGGGRPAFDEGVRPFGPETDARDGIADTGVVDIAGGGKRTSIGVDIQQQRGHLIGAEHFSPAPLEPGGLGTQPVESVGDGGRVVPQEPAGDTQDLFGRSECLGEFEEVRTDGRPVVA